MIVRGGLAATLILARAIVISAFAADLPSPDPEPKWGAWFDFEGTFGTKRHLGEGDLFVPLGQDARTLLFGTLRYRFDNNGSKEGNLGLGLRRMIGDWNLGAYGYFDRRLSENDHFFNQTTFGVEALGRDVDVRANAYLPFGDRIKQVDSLNTAELSGASVVFRGGEERAAPGFDAEIGWRVPLFTAEEPYDLRVYGGGFRFDDPAMEAIAGPRFRADFTAYKVPYLWDGARVTLGAEWQRDGVRGSQGFASLRLRIPLQPMARRDARLTAQERRMTAPVVRDIDVVSQAGTFGAPEAAISTLNGRAINSVVRIDSATTAGAALPGEVTGAGANATVILSGTFNTTAAVTLASGQTMMGGSSALTVRNSAGRTATFTAPGSRGTVAGAINAGNSVVMANDSVLAGLSVSNTAANTGNGVVRLNTVDRVTIIGNTITATTTGAASTRAIATAGNIDTLTVTNNNIVATGPGAVGTSAGLSMAGGGTVETSVTVAGNIFNVSGGANNRTIDADAGNTTFNTAASTGNVLVSGSCNAPGSTGSVGFTNNTTCP